MPSKKVLQMNRDAGETDFKRGVSREEFEKRASDIGEVNCRVAYRQGYVGAAEIVDEAEYIHAIAKDAEVEDLTHLEPGDPGHPCNEGPCVEGCCCCELHDVPDREQTEVIKRPQSEKLPNGNIDATLAERGSRYGEFRDQAIYADKINKVYESSPNWAKMAPDQREALRIVANKIGRILNGDPDYRDNWHDIVGYAKLVDDRLKENEQ